MPNIVTISDTSMGMNSIESPRKFTGYIGESGAYAGPLPLIKNAVRTGGSLRPRCPAHKVLLSTTVGKCLEGYVIALQKNDLFKNMTNVGDETYSSSTNTWSINPNEITAHSLIYISYYNDNVVDNTIMRWIAFPADVESAVKSRYIHTLVWNADYPYWNIAVLSPLETLLYNGDTTCNYIIYTFNRHRYPYDYSVLTGITMSVTGTTLTITDSLAGYRPWRAICRNWNDNWCDFYVTSTSTWYENNYISYINVTATTIQIVFSQSTGLTAQPVSNVYLDLYRYGIIFLTAPTTAPSVEDSSVAGNLIGTYQWAYSYGTTLGEESNLSPWSTELTVSSTKVLVSNLNFNPPFTSNSCMIDRIYIYRRGGTLGSTAIRTNTLYFPWQANPNYTKLYAHFQTAVTSGSTTFYGYTSDVDDWDDIGVVQCVTTGLAWNFGEKIKYTTVTESGTHHSITGLTRGYHSSTAASHSVDTMFLPISILDNLADSSLGTNYPYTSHYSPPAGIKMVATAGSRTCMVCSTYPSKVYVSGIDGWRYHMDLDDVDLNSLTDATVGTILNVGNTDESIVGMIAYGTDTVLTYKENSAYAISVTTTDFPSVETLAGIAGCSNPRTLIVFGKYIFWVHGKECWLWDGDTLYLDIGRNIAEFHDAALAPDQDAQQYMQTAYYNDKLVLFYTLENETTYNSHYIEWDFRHLVEYTEDVYVPTAVIGDEYEARCLTVATDDPRTHIIYGIRHDESGSTTGNHSSMFRLFGTVLEGTVGTYETNADALMVIRLPELSHASLFMQQRIDKIGMVWKYTDTMTACDVTIYPIYNGVKDTDGALTFELPASNALRDTGVIVIADKLPTTDYRSSHFVGLEISSKIDDLVGSTFALYELERIEVQTIDERHDSRQVSDGWPT